MINSARCIQMGIVADHAEPRAGYPPCSGLPAVSEFVTSKQVSITEQDRGGGNDALRIPINGQVRGEATLAWIDWFGDRFQIKTSDIAAPPASGISHTKGEK